MSAPSPSVAPAVFDFPERLGAITVRELRAGLLGRDLVFMLIGVQLALAFAGIYAVEIAPSEPRNAYDLLQSAVWCAAIAGLGLLFPLRGLRALHGDRDSGLLQLLQLTPLSSGGIVVGKFMSLALQTLLYLVTLLPFFALRYFIGGADLIGDAKVLLTLFGASLLLQALCFLLSTVPKLLRGLALVGLVLLVFVFGIQVMFSFSGTGFTAALGGNRWWPLLLLFVWMAVGVAYLLAVAAQSIAAPAENYVLRARTALGLGLAMFFLMWWSGGRATGVRSAPGFDAMLVLSCIAVAIAGFHELASEKRLLAAQVPAWPRGLGFLHVLAPLLLPGWRSASLYYSALALALCVTALLGGAHERLVVLLPAGVVLLLLPRFVLQTIGRRWRHRGVLVHLLLQLALLLPSGFVAAVYALGTDRPSWPGLFPPTAFWNGLAWAHGGDGWYVFPSLLWVLGIWTWYAVQASPFAAGVWRLGAKRTP